MGKISSILGNRSDVQCKYHYNKINKSISSKIRETVFLTNIFHNQNQIHSNNCGIRTFSIQNTDLKENHSLNMNFELKSDEIFKETDNFDNRNEDYEENDPPYQNFEFDSVNLIAKNSFLEDQILQLKKSNKSLGLQNKRLERPNIAIKTFRKKNWVYKINV